MRRLTYGRTAAVFFSAIPFLAIGLAAASRQQPSSVAVAQGSSVEANLDTADRLLRERRLDESQAAFQSALDAAEKSGNVEFEERSLIGLSNVFLQKALYRQAREYGLRGLALAERLGHTRDVGQANLVLGATADLLGDRSEARARLQQAVAMFEAANDRLGRARATLALLRVETKETPETQRLWERSIADAHAGGDTNLEASAYHAHGDTRFWAGDYALALSAYENAAALYTQSNNTEELGSVYNSVGRLYRAHGQLQMALEYQLKALDLHERGSNSFYKMQSLNAVSAVYQMLDDLDRAQTYIERALKVAEQSGSPRIQDFLRANLANILSLRGEYARAIELLESVIIRGVDTHIGLRYAHLAYALQKVGRYDEALRAADTAVSLCAAGDGGNINNDCPLAVQGRAWAHLALGDRAAALRDITAALDRIEEARAKLLPSDFFKQDFLHSQEASYGLAIDLQLREGHGKEALQTAELARARAFIDLLATRDVKLKPTDPLSQLSLTTRGSVLPFAPRELGSDASASPAKATDLIDVARRLNSTLLVYWVAEDKLFIWAVAPDGRIRTARVNVLESKLRALARATVPFNDTATKGAGKTLATRGGDQVAVDTPRSNVWRELYDLLIRPVRGSLPAVPGSLLTVVPHGALANLPFAALQNERGRYLIEDFTLHYAPAGAVLQFTSGKRRADARAGPVLIVADPNVSKDTLLTRPLPPLPGARIEARAIARQLAANRSTLLIGSDATPARVVAAAEGKSVVHFATHAIVRDDAPFASFLALTPDGASASGSMTAEDVYRLNLNADLVVLSACRSGGGRVSGDGIAAFARAFIYAGTPSVIVSLWDVPDQATSLLVPEFYRAWLSGASKSRALRTAQLQMLRNLRTGSITVTTAAGPVVLPEHPIFWAGFSLIGEPK